jgi:hypothetical protein
MRWFVLPLLLVATGAAWAAKPDPAVYPNANTYRDPAIAAAPSAGYAKVLREHCPGAGRGLVHFLEVDGQSIRPRRTWPTYLELAPGAHTLGMEFIGTASNLWDRWEGRGDVRGEFEAGKAYVVRYQRTAVDAFRVWLEPLPDFGSASMATPICRQDAFPDKAYHQ